MYSGDVAKRMCDPMYATKSFEERKGQHVCLVGGGKKKPRDERKGRFPGNRDASQDRPGPQNLTPSSPSHPRAAQTFSSILPYQGDAVGGGRVTITGSGFDVGAPDGAYKCVFNGTSGKSMRANASAVELHDQIVCVLPAWKHAAELTEVYVEGENQTEVPRTGDGPFLFKFLGTVSLPTDLSNPPPRLASHHGVH
jgi:hypothetical protein